MDTLRDKSNLEKCVGRKHLGKSGNRNFLEKKRLLTGHAGFKGSWLAEISPTRCECWLCTGGRSKDDLFNICKLEQRLNHNIVDKGIKPSF